MYARVIFSQYRPEQTDEVIRLYRESVVPEQRKQHGFKGVIVLNDRAAGKGFSITFWETEADLQASDQVSPYYQQQMTKFAAYFTAPPVREAYEVSVQQVQEGRTPLYARVITFQLQPGKIDTWMQITREAVGPVARQQQGYKGILSLIDKSANKIIGISLWETEAAMQAGERSSYVQEQLARVAPVLTASPVQAAYEVSIQA